MKNVYLPFSRLARGISRHRKALRDSVLVTSLLTLLVGFNFGQLNVQVGTGTTTGSTTAQVYTCYNFSYAQDIYTQAELAANGMATAGSITKIRWYYNSGGTTLANWNNWTVYLGNTAQNAFTSTTGWIPASAMTQVFSGTVTAVAGNWLEITLSTPFTYTGGSIVVGVDENAAGYSCTATFRTFTATATTGTERRHILYYSDATNPDPANMSALVANTSSTTTRPQVQFVYCPDVNASAPTVSNVSICANTSATLNASQPFGTNGTINWFDASGTNNLGSGTSFTTPSIASTTVYTAKTTVTGCPSSVGSPVTVSVSPVVATIVPINEACTGYANGSFSLGTVTCGTAPFTYSVDGGAFGAIPTNLATGAHTVIIKDANNEVSSSYNFTIGTQSTIVPPAPTVTNSPFNYCSGVTTANISAVKPIGTSPATCSVTATASGTDNTNVTATVSNFSCASAGTISGATLNATIGANCGGSSGWYYYNIVVNGVTVATNQCNQTGFNLTPYLPLTSVAIVSYDDPNDGFGDFVNMSATVNLTYQVPANPQPAYILNWYDAATAGNNVGVGDTINAIGTSVTPASIGGSYQYYVGTTLGGCNSTTRVPVTMNLTDVNATLSPVNVLCNGASTGSFVLGTVQCGTAPFTYAINGGTAGPIPTNLTAGTYTVIMHDANGLQSAPITVVISEPSAPQNAIAYNTNVFSADLTWTPQGNETEWTVIYGPTGFNPATAGTTVIATNDSIQIAPLTGATSYEFYVFANCGASNDTTGPIAFSTIAPYFVWDSGCISYNDISATGTPLNTTDDTEFGMVFPFPFNYQGISLSDITIGNNGGILFGTQTGNVSYTMAASTPNANAIFPFVQDLATPANSNGNLYTEVVGTAPNRQFIVQWHNIMHYSTSPSTVSFQVVFVETSNEIYFLYDDVTFGTTNWDNGGDAEIGVMGTIDYNVSMNNASYLTNNSCAHFYYNYCPNVENLTATIYQEEIQLDWNPGQYGETAWTVIYGPTGFDPATSGTTLAVNTSDVTIPGLTQLTDYDVYIYSECTQDTLTSPGLMAHYQTLPWCNNPVSTNGSVAGLNIDSVNVTWNWTPVAGAINGLTGFNIQYGPTGFQPGNGTIVAANDINFADTITDVALMAGGLYQGYVQAVCGTDTSNFAGPFNFIMPLSNDTVCGAEMLQVDGTVYVFNNSGATVSPGEASIAPPLTGYLNNTGWGSNTTPQSTTWFKFVAPPSGQVRLDQTDVNWAGKSAVYEIDSCDVFSPTNFILQGANENYTFPGYGAVNFTICGLTPGNEYYIMNSARYSGSYYQGNYSIKLTEIVLEGGNTGTTINACLADTINLFTTINGYDLGGSWSWVTPTAGLSDSLFNTNGSASQIFEFEYRVTDGCAYDSVIGRVKVYPPSSAGVDGQIDVCRNQPVNLLSGLSGNIDLGGSWINPSNQTLASGQINASNIPGQFNYQYITGNGICPNDTAEVLVNVLANCNYLDLEELAFENMNLHPNPSTGLINISNSNSSEVFNLEVTDLEGRTVLVAEKAINGNSNYQLDLTGKESGVYLVKVFNTTSKKTFRVVLQ